MANTETHNSKIPKLEIRNIQALNTTYTSYYNSVPHGYLLSDQFINVRRGVSYLPGIHIDEFSGSERYERYSDWYPYSPADQMVLVAMEAKLSTIVRA